MFNTVATVICNPAAPILDNALAGRIMAALDPIDMSASRRETLGEGVAEDFYCPGQGDATEIRSALLKALDGVPVDVVVQPAHRRPAKLLIADMDSTIIEQECIDELADFVGKRVEISAITERAMRGELDFDGALRERVAMLKGLDEAKLEEAFRKRISLTPGASTLVRTMRARGAFTALVSGGFTFFTARVAEAAGFNVDQANTLRLADGALTGAVGEPILGREAKREALERFANEQGVELADAIAVGDGANDLDMLRAAGLGVAFRAKPAVAAQADAVVSHGDLTALLYLQGIPQSDFVSD
ncbi:MAG: phosphoserine phosphatase SerB [Pseudomonadota bacterium]